MENWSTPGHQQPSKKSSSGNHQQHSTTTTPNPINYKNKAAAPIDKVLLTPPLPTPSAKLQSKVKKLSKKAKVSSSLEDQETHNSPNPNSSSTTKTKPKKLKTNNKKKDSTGTAPTPKTQRATTPKSNLSEVCGSEFLSNPIVVPVPPAPVPVLVDTTSPTAQDDSDPDLLILNQHLPQSKPKIRKLRKPTAEEDIVDGFAILGFKSYEELTRAIKLGEESPESRTNDTKLCVQLLRRSQDGSAIKNPKKSKSPTTLPINNNHSDYQINSTPPNPKQTNLPVPIPSPKLPNHHPHHHTPTTKLNSNSNPTPSTKKPKKRKLSLESHVDVVESEEISKPKKISKKSSKKIKEKMVNTSSNGTNTTTTTSLLTTPTTTTTISSTISNSSQNSHSLQSTNITSSPPSSSSSSTSLPPIPPIGAGGPLSLSSTLSVSLTPISNPTLNLATQLTTKRKQPNLTNNNTTNSHTNNNNKSNPKKPRPSSTSTSSSSSSSTSVDQTIHSIITDTNRKISKSTTASKPTTTPTTPTTMKIKKKKKTQSEGDDDDEKKADGKVSENLNNNNGDLKINSYGCSSLFAPTQKDSSTQPSNNTDNLLSDQSTSTIDKIEESNKNPQILGLGLLEIDPSPLLPHPPPSSPSTTVKTEVNHKDQPSLSPVPVPKEPSSLSIAIPVLPLLPSTSEEDGDGHRNGEENIEKKHDAKEDEQGLSKELDNIDHEDPSNSKPEESSLTLNGPINLAAPTISKTNGFPESQSNKLLESTETKKEKRPKPKEIPANESDEENDSSELEIEDQDQKSTKVTVAKIPAPSKTTLFTPYATTPITHLTSQVPDANLKPKSPKPGGNAFGSIARLLLDQPPPTSQPQPSGGHLYYPGGSSTSSSPHPPQGLSPSPNLKSPRDSSSILFPGLGAPSSSTTPQPPQGMFPPQFQLPLPHHSAESALFSGVSQSELLVRRELESRFIVSSAAGNQFINPLFTTAGNGFPPPPMFKDMKVDSGSFYRSLNISPGAVGFPGSPLGSFNGVGGPGTSSASTPFTTPPNPLIHSLLHQQQQPTKKTGRWNAMHVRIAWEIYQHQQKGSKDSGGGSNTPPNLSLKNSLLHPPTITTPPVPTSSTIHVPRGSGAPLSQPQFDPSSLFHHSLQHPHQHHHLAMAAAAAAAQLGPRYGGPFGGMGPNPFGNMMGRDLSLVGSLGGPDWQRFSRSVAGGGGSPYPPPPIGGGNGGVSWTTSGGPPQLPQTPPQPRQLKTTESRHQKHHHGKDERHRDREGSSPYPRDRSPHSRPSSAASRNRDRELTSSIPHENGSGIGEDSVSASSSRSQSSGSNSNSTSASVHNNQSNKHQQVRRGSPSPSPRHNHKDTNKHHEDPPSIPDKGPPSNFSISSMSVSDLKSGNSTPNLPVQTSKLYNPTSPSLGVGGIGWDGFPTGLFQHNGPYGSPGGGSRGLSSPESFRLSLLEREFNGRLVGSGGHMLRPPHGAGILPPSFLTNLNLLPPPFGPGPLGSLGGGPAMGPGPKIHPSFPPGTPSSHLTHLANLHQFHQQQQQQHHPHPPPTSQNHPSLPSRNGNSNNNNNSSPAPQAPPKPSASSTSSSMLEDTR